MKSIRDIYKIGRGPSSSHTMGPERASKLFRAEHPDADRFEAVLYGSLAKTGRGHGTDRIIAETFAPIPVDIVWNGDDSLVLPHPNTMDLTAFRGETKLGSLRIMSVGGGDIRIEGRPEADPPEVYAEQSFAEISAYCKKHRLRISDYVEENEGPEIWDFLYGVWNTMCDAIQDGLTSSGTLPGGLNVERKAQTLYNQRHIDEQGNRLGMGCGYYDRFLPGCENAFLAAVAFEYQRTARIPAEPWDRPMDAAVTENGTLYFDR